VTALGVVLGILPGAALIFLLRRARGERLRPRPRPGAFRPTPDGTRWLPCHDVACAHMTTRWFPQPDGAARCENSAHHQGEIRV
jgi:hypothetical protein